MIITIKKIGVNPATNVTAEASDVIGVLREIWSKSNSSNKIAIYVGDEKGEPSEDIRVAVACKLFGNGVKKAKHFADNPSGHSTAKYLFVYENKLISECIVTWSSDDQTIYNGNSGDVPIINARDLMNAENTVK